MTAAELSVSIRDLSDSEINDFTLSKTLGVNTKLLDATSDPARDILKDRNIGRDAQLLILDTANTDLIQEFLEIQEIVKKHPNQKIWLIATPEYIPNQSGVNTDDSSEYDAFIANVNESATARGGVIGVSTMDDLRNPDVQNYIQNEIHLAQKQ